MRLLTGPPSQHGLLTPAVRPGTQYPQIPRNYTSTHTRAGGNKARGNSARTCDSHTGSQSEERGSPQWMDEKVSPQWIFLEDLLRSLSAFKESDPQKMRDLDTTMSKQLSPRSPLGSLGRQPTRGRARRIVLSDSDDENVGECSPAPLPTTVLGTWLRGPQSQIHSTRTWSTRKNQAHPNGRWRRLHMRMQRRCKMRSGERRRSSSPRHPHACPYHRCRPHQTVPTLARFRVSPNRSSQLISLDHQPSGN